MAQNRPQCEHSLRRFCVVRHARLWLCRSRGDTPSMDTANLASCGAGVTWGFASSSSNSSNNRYNCKCKSTSTSTTTTTTTKQNRQAQQPNEPTNTHTTKQQNEEAATTNKMTTHNNTKQQRNKERRSSHGLSMYIWRPPYMEASYRGGLM